MRLTADQRDWDELGTVDPAWAILTEPTRRGGRWDTEEFLATGPRDVADALARFAALDAPSYDRALDFGCGLGRLSRALSASFDEVVGVDIAPAMVQGAREINAEVEGLTFVCNDRADLREVTGDASCDLVFSFIALQHVSSREAIVAYLREFVRVLRPGGLIAFQLPSHIAPLQRLQPRRHAYRALRRVGVPPTRLQTWSLHPMAMRFLPVHQTSTLLTGAGARMLDAVTAPPNPDFPGYTSTTYYATR